MNIIKILIFKIYNIFYKKNDNIIWPNEVIKSRKTSYSIKIKPYEDDILDDDDIVIYYLFNEGGIYL